MTRRIVWINLALFALLAAGAVELRNRWLAAEKRKANALAVKPLPPAASIATAPSASASASAVSPAQYFEVAEKFLFSKDRNPTVVVEEKAPPPPPKPMPELPNVFGVMNLGFGPTVFMSLGGNPQQGYKVGDTIGEFKLVAASSKELTFTWEDKSVTATLEELLARARPAQAQQANPAAAISRPGAQPDFSLPPPVKPPENVKAAPGSDIGGDRRGCVPGDSSPSGTVVDGWRKTSAQYAFGPICFWEKAR
jgi:hypothetical protein